MLLGAARGAMLKKTFPWIVFFGVLLLLVFSASSYVQVIDSLLWPIRFGILAGFSVLFARYWWRHQNDSGTTMKGRQILRIIFSLPRFAGSTAM
jgi:hypothetical protein